MAKKSAPSLQEETLLWNQGGVFVFGVDEAGRGCLAGPVCAAVSCWESLPEDATLPVPVRDSKLMREAEREACFDPIKEKSLTYGVGFASREEIDRWNILRANHLAVARALEAALVRLVSLGRVRPGLMTETRFGFLSDGNRPLVEHTKEFAFSPEYGAELPLLRELLRLSSPERCIVKGDSKVFSIAAASVLAKVSRDRHMQSLHARFPEYDFATHKGYSTARHVEILRRLGPCEEHRRSFSPVSESLLLFSQA